MRTIISALLLCSACLVASPTPPEETVALNEKPPERICVQFPNEDIRTCFPFLCAGTCIQTISRDRSALGGAPILRFRHIPTAFVPLSLVHAP